MLALIVVVPVADELITAEHEPVPPNVVQLLAPTKLPGPETIAKVIVVPLGAFTHPPVPVLTLTCPVSVWFVEIGFVAD